MTEDCIAVFRTVEQTYCLTVVFETEPPGTNPRRFGKTRVLVTLLRLTGSQFPSKRVVTSPEETQIFKEVKVKL